jgi:ABC-2 type transport system permease protein
MNAWLALFSVRFRAQLQYRTAALAGAGTQLFWGFIRIMTLEAFYASGAEHSSLTLEQTITYLWLGQAFLALLPWNHDRELEAHVRSGNVVYEWLRPSDLYALWFARTLAMRAGGAALRSLPILVFAGLLLPFTPLAGWALQPPSSAAAFVGFALAMALGIALSAALTTLVHVSLLWTISGQGMAGLVPSLVLVFSGMLVPLPLFPDALQPLLVLLPFPALADVPYRLYIGHLAPRAALPALGAAAFWTLALIAAGRALLARGQRRMIVQGG